MKVVHICLSCFYIDKYNYQENALVRQHVLDGHDVTVIASTENYDANRKLTYSEPRTYTGTDHAKVIRLPYRSFLPHGLAKKLRMHPKVYALLVQEKPDVILFHGLCGWELKTAFRYRHKHPNVKLYVDSHEDRHNSARSRGSMLLHRWYYRPIIQYCEKRYSLKNVLCVSLEVADFVHKTYGLSKEILEFYPLGGQVFDDADYTQRREQGRAKYQLQHEHILLVQTGKMGRRKKILESLDAFIQTTNPNLRFVLAGSFEDGLEAAIHAKIAQDERIQYIGWVNAADLAELLCATDVYIQPGTQSATMQMSLCARCPVVLDDTPSHQPFVNGNGWLIKDAARLVDVFNQIAQNPATLVNMSQQSLSIARELLDYKSLAARILR